MRKTKTGFSIPVNEIITIVGSLLSAVEAIDKIFSGFFNFLCKNKEKQAKEKILDILDALPPEFYGADDELVQRSMRIRAKFTQDITS